MRLITALPLLAGLMLSTNLMAADATTATKTPSPAQAAQQKRMTDCNQQASTKSLKGADRSTFMSTCLKSEGAAATGKTLTPQQQKMKTCNADAKTKNLKGDARKTFMSSCLKNRPDLPHATARPKRFRRAVTPSQHQPERFSFFLSPALTLQQEIGYG